MTILTSANGSLPLTLRKGETLVIRNYSGVESVLGSSVGREDASSSIGAGAVVYGPQTSDVSVVISTTGSMDFSTVMGDPTPNSAQATVTRDSSTGAITGLIDPLTGRELASSVRARIYCRQPAGGASTAFGTAVAQVRWYVPFGGQTVQVRCVYRNDATGADLITADTAATSGRSFSELNPLTAAGSAATFVTAGAGITVAAAASAAVPRLGRSAWMTVDVIEDAGRPGWGTIYVRSQFTSGGRAIILGADPAPAEFLAAATLFKCPIDFRAGLTPITGALDGSTVQNYSNRPFWIEVRTLGGDVRTVAAFGDSRVSGVGTEGGQYGWAQRACSDLNAQGLPVGYENWGLASTTSDTFLDRLNARLAVGDCPDVVLWQPGSNNDTNAWTEAVVSAQIARMIEAKEKVESLGGVFVPVTMFPSAGANTDDKVTQWLRLNSAARACRHYIEFDVAPFNNGAAIPAVPNDMTVDGTHINATWQQVLASIAAHSIRQAAQL